MEAGYGEKREEALRIAGLKTYFIVKTLIPVSSSSVIDCVSPNKFLY